MNGHKARADSLATILAQPNMRQYGVSWSISLFLVNKLLQAECAADDNTLDVMWNLWMKASLCPMSVTSHRYIIFIYDSLLRFASPVVKAVSRDK